MYTRIIDIKCALLNALSEPIASKKFRAYKMLLNGIEMAFMDNEVVDIEPSRGGFICNIGTMMELVIKRLITLELNHVNKITELDTNVKALSYRDNGDITINGVCYNIVCSTTYSLASVRKYQNFDKYIVVSDLGVKVVDKDNIKIATNGKISNKQKGEPVEWLECMLGLN